jgi:PqqD family protein of HPr-rel-A system
VRYRAADPATLRIVPLDILTAIYHRRSGQTHLVEAPVPEILEALQAGSATVDGLLTRLAARYDLADPDAVALAARLDELVAAGLVERE